MSALRNAPGRITGGEIDWRVEEFSHERIWTMAFKERREHSRTKVKWPVSMSTAHGLVDGLVKNISLGGALVQSLELPSAEETPRLRIEIPEHRHSVVATAKVIRFDVCDGDSFVYELGVSLLEISDKDRLTLNNAILFNVHSGSGKS